MTTKTSAKDQNNGQFSTDELRQLVQDEAMKRSENCQKKIEAEVTATLQEFNCTVAYYGMLPSRTWVPITDGNFVKGQLKVIPL